MKDYEQNYEDNWKDIIEPGGRVDMDAVKRELFDYWNFMEQAAKVYDHVTGGRISKVNTMADSVISEADAHYEEIYSSNAACSPPWGEVTQENGKLYFRWDFDEYENPKESQTEYYECQEMLREIGWEITEPLIKHNCISGPLGRYFKANA